jgi:hypothetical protein
MRAIRAALLMVIATGAFQAIAAPARQPEPTKGALKRRADPKSDLEAQRKNQKRLRENALRDRENGNRIGAWAAESDAKEVEKLIKRDEELLRNEQDKESAAKQPDE